jgi:serine/threonine protein kinase
VEPLTNRDPKVIGEFTLIGRLGAGGMGVVYLASRRSESVALKIIREHLVEDSGQAARFAREIQTLASIDSPNVAQLIDSGTDADGRVWFATEFVNGPDLDSRVKDKGPLSIDDWWALAEGLLNALTASHEVGVTHRDIKPANVILSESGPKLIDFGIAQMSEATSVTSTGMVAGTPAWFSPEQIEGLSIEPVTDVFSAGSAMVFAANGRTPWGDQTTMTKASVFKILTAEPDLSELDPTQSELVTAMLYKEPQQRPSAGLLLANLESIRDGSVTSADLVSPGADKGAVTTNVVARSSLLPAGPPRRNQSQVSNRPVAAVMPARLRPAMNWRSRKIVIPSALIIALLAGGGTVGGLALQNATGPIKLNSVDSAGTSNETVGAYSLTVTNASDGASDTWSSRDSLRVVYAPPYSKDQAYDEIIEASELGLTGFSSGQQLNAKLELKDDQAVITLAVEKNTPAKTITLTRENENADLAQCAQTMEVEVEPALAGVYSLGSSVLAQLDSSGLGLLNVPGAELWLVWSEWANKFGSFSSAFPASAATVRSDTLALPPAVRSSMEATLAKHSALGQASAALGDQYQNLFDSNAASGTEVDWEPFWDAGEGMFGQYPWSSSRYIGTVKESIADGIAGECSTAIN